MNTEIYEIKHFRNRHKVFTDRFEAGEILGEMLKSKYAQKDNLIVLAIPSGGVPVGVRVSARLSAPLDLIIVRKLQIPWNTEAGFGAMTQDGSVFLNEGLMAELNLSPAQIERQTDKLRKELKTRNQQFRGGRPLIDMNGKTAILVDDGLASGYTLKASIYMANKGGAEKIIAAVPTAPLRSLETIASAVTEIYCPNIREEFSFAVASAYEDWYDLSDDEVIRILESGA